MLAAPKKSPPAQVQSSRGVISSENHTTRCSCPFAPTLRWQYPLAFASLRGRRMGQPNGLIKIISTLDSQISSAPVHGAQLLQVSILRHFIRCRQIEGWKVAYAGDIVVRVQTYRYYFKFRWIARLKLNLGLGVNILDQDARMIRLLR